MKRLTGPKMEDTICRILDPEGYDMFFFLFTGHGFGKGPGFLYGSDMKVKPDAMTNSLKWYTKL
jgi:hypothetical protein